MNAFDNLPAHVSMSKLLHTSFNSRKSERGGGGGGGGARAQASCSA